MRSPVLLLDAESGADVLMSKEGVERGGLILFLAAITLALAGLAFGFAGALLWHRWRRCCFRPCSRTCLAAGPGNATSRPE